MSMRSMYITIFGLLLVCAPTGGTVQAETYTLKLSISDQGSPILREGFNAFAKYELIDKITDDNSDFWEPCDNLIENSGNDLSVICYSLESYELVQDIQVGGQYDSIGISLDSLQDEPMIVESGRDPVSGDPLWRASLITDQSQWPGSPGRESGVRLVLGFGLPSFEEFPDFVFDLQAILDDDISIFPDGATPQVRIRIEGFGGVVVDETIVGSGQTMFSLPTTSEGGYSVQIEQRVAVVKEGEPPLPEIVVVPVDVAPTKCPNVIHTTRGNFVTAAILGTETFDVTRVNAATVRLAGVSPCQWNLVDVATPFEPFVDKQEATDCHTLGRDGSRDLQLRFKTEVLADFLRDLNDGEVTVLKLEGRLKEEFGGQRFKGEDVIVVKTLAHRRRTDDSGRTRD